MSKIFKGIKASPGIALGKALVWNKKLNLVEAESISASEIEAEIKKFRAALEETKKEILTLKKEVALNTGYQQAKIFEVQKMILEDEIINSEVEKKIRESRTKAGYVYQEVLEKTVRSLRSSEDQYIRERVQDISGIKERVLSHLTGKADEFLDFVKPLCILFTATLTPGEAVLAKKHNILGVVTRSGSDTSHVAILARSLELPLIVGLSENWDLIHTGEEVILDGNQGMVICAPEEREIQEYKIALEKIEKQKQHLLDLKNKIAQTKDGRKITLAANIELPEQAEEALSYGASEIGLFRTEYLYLTEQKFPSEDQQLEAYQKVAFKFYPQSVIIRTYDLGGDKFLSGDEPKEANPFLGWRAIRSCLDRPEIFKAQLRAILKASVKKNIKIMLPMISSVDEIEQTKKILAGVKAELKKSQIEFDRKIPLGIMIEVPSAVIIAEALAGEVDFFSIGTNDLIQYTLAAERGSVKVARYYQNFHPAVLSLISQTVRIGHKHKIWVGICGEMASDTVALSFLVGAGIDELSMNSHMIPEIKEKLSKLEYKKCQRIADKVLKFSRASQVEDFLKQNLPRGY